MSDVSITNIVGDSGSGGCGGCLIIFGILIIAGIVFPDGSIFNAANKNSGETSEISRKRVDPEQLVESVKQWQYVNTSALSRIEKNNYSAIVATKGSESFNVALVNELKNRDVNASESVLKPTIFRTNIFELISNGNTKLLNRLGLSPFSGYLMLNRLSFSKFANTGRWFKTRATLKVTIVPLGSKPTAEHFFSARGAGFNKSNARRQAERRVLKDLLKDGILTN